MSPEARDIAADIAAVGKTATLRRVAPGGTIWFDVTVKAAERQYSLQELSGQIAQGDREVRISNKEILEHSWPGPPRRGDEIELAGVLCAVEAVETKTIGDESVMHILQARG